MSIPTNEPIFSEGDRPVESVHRRRPRRSWLPQDPEENKIFLDSLDRQITPGVDFYIFTLISGLILGAAILLDSSGMYILAILLSPFLGPVFAFWFGAVIGSGKFFLKELVGLIASCALIFALSAAAGMIAHLLPADTPYEQAGYHALFAWPDFLVLAVGAGLATYMLVRSPRQKPLVANVALAYELFLPLAVAGFGLTSKVPGLWIDGLLVFLIHLAWTALAGVLVLLVMGLRPANLFGYTLAIAVVLIGLAASIVIIGLNSPRPVLVTLPTAGTPTATGTTVIASETATPEPGATPQPAVTAGPSITLTASIIPSMTPTLTVTSEPTPVWALIDAPSGNGAVVRDAPDGKILTSLLNGNTVQVISGPVRGDGEVIWVQVRTESGLEGWMVQSLLATATPAPGW